ncbi:plasmid recombination protein [Massilia sp. P8910]|uniref:plasmid recombination protein n=1 Tax=Massilia antarctica TaxID=2765360 RepID=UPI001E46DEC7|nr:plasmid recombination protein [Massilia antarctica]MCE3608062.1 plasmid recombination protein [Massilia antarctica]
MAQEFVQFVHSESYGEVSSGRKITAEQNLGEAMRIPGHCPHVKKPMTPNTLFLASDPLSCLIPLIHDLKRQAFEASGQRMRKDAQVLLAGVASFPVPMSELRNRTKEAAASHALYEEWIRLNLAWLHRRYGSHLYAVTAHSDELYPHIHWHCPGFIKNGRFTMGGLHAGQEAGKRAVAAAVEANGGPLDGKLRKKTYNDAYKAAEKEFQDDYWQHVGKPLGMLRVSSKPRRRAPRGVHLANVRASEAEERARLAEEESARLRAELDRVNMKLALNNLEFAAIQNTRASDAHP